MKKGKKDNRLPLSDLPQYTPPEIVWENISESLDTGSAKELKSPVTPDFPKHTPPADVWKEIEYSLDLKDQISALPDYTPPAIVWKNIENALSDTGKAEHIKFRPLLKWAAAILLLAGIAVVVNILRPPATELEYHVEWEQMDESIEVSPGMSGFEMIAKLCARSKQVCDTPEFTRLENELTELEKAREQVKSQMSPYGDNHDLERMLMRIEMEHAEIMKQMASSLL